MTLIIVIFFISLALSLILTPQVSRFAKKCGIIDAPSDRKVHTQCIPRAGGVAIYLAFLLSFIAVFFYRGIGFESLFDRRTATFIIGASLAFLLGLWDDVRHLDSRTKFAAQMMIGILTYGGGISIKAISIFSVEAIELGWMSMPVTVFWFVLVMNAINLIDGLDGLAAGISLFVALVLLIICVKMNNLQVALGFAALGGATLGFLKYNFNPASVFMGDSGSYFIGYTLAGLAIMGAIKGPATVAILIPVVALGVPLMDVLFAPIRRFVLGAKMFSPDKNHLHHRLLKLGFTHRNTVLILYGVSIVMGLLSVTIVHAKDDGIALILFVFGITVISAIRKLGYADYFGLGNIQDWLKDISDELGISRDRRNFLNFQVDIYHSCDVKTLWVNICKALEKLGFDMAEMYLEKKIIWQNLRKALEKMGFETSELPVMLIVKDDAENKMVWKRDGFNMNYDVCKECMLKVELPLMGNNGQSFGSIWLIKDVRRDAINHSTLRRVEYLRRTVLSSLQLLIGATRT